MTEFLKFDNGFAPDTETMDREELKDYLARVRAELDRLDGEEPQDMDSEEYEAWGDRHEELEDLVDEIWDRLEEE